MDKESLLIRVRRAISIKARIQSDVDKGIPLDKASKELGFKIETPFK
jgi:hypothetical protein